MSETRISELENNDLVTGTFLTTRKDLRQTKKGDPYLALSLTDKSGSIEGRIWNDVEMLSSRFEVGDVVKIQGRVDSFRGDLQVIVDDIKKIPSDNIDLSQFMPSSRWAPVELINQLEQFLKEHVSRLSLNRLVEEIFSTDEIVEALQISPAATHNHHNYVGGLAEHTLSMLRLAIRMADHYDAYYPGLIDEDILLMGTLFHDLGKCRELKHSATFEYSDTGQLTGHIVQGIEMLNELIDVLDDTIDEKLINQIKHLILSHHGKLEYGSPVEPKTAEALLLHQIDVIDSQLNMCADVVSDHVGSSDDGNWTSRISALGNRSLFIDDRWNEGGEGSLAIEGPGQFKSDSDSKETDEESSPNLNLFS